MLFRASARPSTSNNAVLGICKEAIDNLNPRNTVLIFTHCDQDTQMNAEYGVEWYNEGLIATAGLP